MTVGMPASTGDVLSASMFNSLVSFTLNDQTGTSYTPVLTDQYQVLVTRSNASASTMTIPTNASVAFPVGTVITVLNQYKSCALIQTSANNWYVVWAIA